MIATSVWVILAPVIAAQYILAVIGLIVLSRRRLSARAYIVWNIVILLVFFIGSIVFLLYNAARPAPRTSAAQPIDETQQDVYNKQEENGQQDEDGQGERHG